MTVPEFTAHNIRLEGSRTTRPGDDLTIDESVWFQAARRWLDLLYPEEATDRRQVKILDLGCLEGGYSVEFARMGFDVTGIEVRRVNMEACNYVKEATGLENLRFIQDDARNAEQYGIRDFIFCSGLLYHLQKPVEFMEQLSRITRRALFLQTHFSTRHPFRFGLPLALAFLYPILNRVSPAGVHKYKLSRLTKNEDRQGRWYWEHLPGTTQNAKELKKWASYDNNRSFWLCREDLISALEESGFDLVLEQFDALEPPISENMKRGYYKTDDRGTFVGIKGSVPTPRG